MVTAATQAKNVASNGTAVEAEEFHDFELSRPAFLAGKCKGTIQGVIFNVLGPFEPGKSSKIKKNWFAYEVKLTAAAELVGTDKVARKYPSGTVAMVPISAHLKNLAPYVVGDKVYNFRLTPGAAPGPQEMRVWTVQRGNAYARGNDYPLLGSRGANPLLALPEATASDDEEAPF